MRTPLLLAATVLLAACDSSPTVAPVVPQHQHSSDLTSAFARPTPALRAQLAAARAVSARYERLENAIADGFADINVFIPGMGYHYMNVSRLDDKFDVEKPELLVYSPTLNGRMRLVAVEYAVPTALAKEPPSGFAGTRDVWDNNTTFHLWTLHAWVWLENPSGVFAPLNPRLF